MRYLLQDRRTATYWSPRTGRLRRFKTALYLVHRSSVATHWGDVRSARRFDSPAAVAEQARALGLREGEFKVQRCYL